MAIVPTSRGPASPTPTSPLYDVAIVGGGIVGLATAYQLLRRYAECRVLVIEKEGQLAAHQSGRNSGVLHSGIYYRPGSLRAENCRVGKAALEAFCRDEGIAYELCGKVIVATCQEELERLDMIFARGQANGVRCEMISRERLVELEPHAAGVQAIHVPETGIVDYRQVVARLAQRVTSAGGEIRLSTRLVALRQSTEQLQLETTAGEFAARCLVNCAGVYSDRVAKLGGVDPRVRIVPFRGEYYELLPEARHLCQNLIYPVPEPSFPFLGVHLTRMIGGAVECGPNAVLALSREGYRRRDVRVADLVATLGYRGFLRLAVRHWQSGLGEMWRSWSKRAFVRALQRLVPEIRTEWLVEARAGIRAQAVTPAGQLVDDFLIVEQGRIVNVCNAPSPAATASLHIGQQIVDKLAERLA